jgi:FMN-dependent NADH-azoreductase
VKLLEIQSSPRGESSDSITLTKSFLEACKSADSIVVDTSLGAKYKAVKHETMTEAGSTVLARIQSFIQRCGRSQMEDHP